jgi:hypothetical protein
MMFFIKEPYPSTVSRQKTSLHDLAFLNKLALDSGFQIFQV